MDKFENKRVKIKVVSFFIFIKITEFQNSRFELTEGKRRSFTAPGLYLRQGCVNTKSIAH